MKRSHGYYSKHSRHLRSRKKSISKRLEQFAVGSAVRINVDPRQSGIPLRFNGRTAKVVAKQGKGYVVEFSDGNATKRLAVASAHLDGC